MSKVIPADHIDGWYWDAQYDDGSHLEELEDDGTPHGYAEIDQSRLVAFFLRPLDPSLPQFAVQVQAGEALIFFRRRSLIASLGADGDIAHQHRGPSYQVIGVRRGETDAVVFIDQGGNAVISTDRNAVQFREHRVATNITFSPYGTRTTALSTELNALASGSRALATTPYDNTTNHDLYADFELLVAFGTGPTTGSLDLYLLPSTDGTNYADGSNTVVPALANLAGSFVPQNSSAQQRLSLPARTIPPGKFQVLLVNNGTSQALAASGNTLTLTPYHLQSA